MAWQKKKGRMLWKTGDPGEEPAGESERRRAGADHPHGGGVLQPALRVLMGLILLTWKRVHGLPHEDVLTMFWTACVANRVYRLTRRRNTSDIVTLLISLAFLIWNLVKFLQIAG